MCVSTVSWAPITLTQVAQSVWNALLDHTKMPQVKLSAGTVLLVTSPASVAWPNAKFASPDPLEPPRPHSFALIVLPAITNLILDRVSALPVPPALTNPVLPSSIAWIVNQDVTRPKTTACHVCRARLGITKAHTGKITVCLVPWAFLILLPVNRSACPVSQDTTPRLKAVKSVMSVLLGNINLLLAPWTAKTANWVNFKITRVSPPVKNVPLALTPT